MYCVQVDILLVVRKSHYYTSTLILTTLHLFHKHTPKNPRCVVCGGLISANICRDCSVRQETIANADPLVVTLSIAFSSRRKIMWSKFMLIKR